MIVEKGESLQKCAIRENIEENSSKIIEHIDNIKEDIIKSEIKKVLGKKYNINVERIEKNMHYIG